MARERARVLLVGLNRLPRELLEAALVRHGGFEIAGVLERPEELRHALDRTEAEVIVFGIEDEELPAECRAVVEAHARLRLLGLTADGRRAVLYRLETRRTALDDRTPEELAEAAGSSSAAGSETHPLADIPPRPPLKG
jgi:DNA-binding NarL/FixJ family response regulator